MSQCFGAGMNQLMSQARGGSQYGGSQYGGSMGLSGGYGNGYTQNLAANIPAQSARSYKNFYAQAYDSNGYPKMLSASPQAIARFLFIWNLY